MRMQTLRRTGLAAAAAAACLVGIATPASATTYGFDMDMTSGRISVGTTNFDTPNAGGPALCPGSTNISGTIDDVAGTITSSLSINSSEFPLPLFGGTYKLTATGTGSGTYSAGTFSGLAYNPITFTIKPINTTTCAVGSTVCSGTASLTAGGALHAGSTLPLSTGESVYVNSTAGSILTTTGCTFPWNQVVKPGAALSLKANPTLSPVPPGAIFTQR